jgi:hypothetical protein
VLFPEGLGESGGFSDVLRGKNGVMKMFAKVFEFLGKVMGVLKKALLIIPAIMDAMKKVLGIVNDDSCVCGEEGCCCQPCECGEENCNCKE